MPGHLYFQDLIKIQLFIPGLVLGRNEMENKRSPDPFLEL